MIRKPKDNKISGNSIGNPCIQLQHLFGDSRKNNLRQIYGGIAREKGMHGSLLSNKYSEEESVQMCMTLAERILDHREWKGANHDRRKPEQFPLRSLKIRNFTERRISASLVAIKK